MSLRTVSVLGGLRALGERGGQVLCSAVVLQGLRWESSTTTSADPVMRDPLPPAEFGSDREIEETSARIFGRFIGNGERSGRKVIKKGLIGAKLAAYYPPPIWQHDPIFSDPADGDKQNKLATLKRRGKGPPKKGEGKRASKGKK